MTLLADRLLIDFNTTWERIRQVTEWKSYVECSNYLSIKPGTFAGAKKRGTIPFEWLMEISEGCGVTLDWLIRGKGGKWRDGFVIGDAIKRRREFLKITVDDLAARVGVATDVIKSWEEDKAQPQRPQMESLTRVLGIAPGILKTQSGEATDVHHHKGPYTPPGDANRGSTVAEFKISEDLTLAAQVLESGTPHATTALRLDIRSFTKPVTTEARIAQIEENQKRFNDLLTQIQTENKALRTELDRLKANCEPPDEG